jgi:hypothetical protein
LSLPNETDHDSAQVEAHAVVENLEREHFAENISHCVRTRIAEAEEIDVSGRSMRLAGPEREQCSPFSTNRSACLDDASRNNRRSFA